MKKPKQVVKKWLLKTPLKQYYFYCYLRGLLENDNKIVNAKVIDDFESLGSITSKQAYKLRHDFKVSQSETVRALASQFIAKVKQDYEVDCIRLKYVYDKDFDIHHIYHDNEFLEYHNKEFNKYIGKLIKKFFTSKKIYNIDVSYNHEFDLEQYK